MMMMMSIIGSLVCIFGIPFVIGGFIVAVSDAPDDSIFCASYLISCIINIIILLKYMEATGVL